MQVVAFWRGRSRRIARGCGYLGQAMSDPIQPAASYADNPTQGVNAPRAVNHLLLPVILPVGVIRSIWRAMPLGRAYLVHLYGVALACLGLALADLTFKDPLLVSALYDPIALGELVSSAVGFVLFIEVAYPIAAFVTMCWGAAPEPWLASYKRALTRWYQLTPWHAAVSLVYAGVASVVTDGGPGSAALVVLTLISVAYCLGLMWVTLRALSVHEQPGGWPAACRWPLTCEGCGYSLYSQSLEQACPECGRPVSTSAEAGRGGIGRLPLGVLVLRGLFQPKRLGTHAVTRRPTTDHHRAIWAGVFCVFITPMLVTTAVMAVFLAIDPDMGRFFEFDEFFAMQMGVTLFSAFATLWVVLGGLLAGTLLGTLYRVCWKQRIMHLAGQAVAYRSPWLVLWMLGGGAVMWAMVGIAVSMAFGGAPSPFYVIALPVLAVVSQFVFAGLYMLFLLPVVRGARYANV
jgi:hypothetical protein